MLCYQQSQQHEGRLSCSLCGPVWVRGHCRINPPRFLAECCKRWLNHGSFVLLYFRLSTLFDLYLIFVCLFSCIVFVFSFCVFIFLYSFVCQYQSSHWLWRPPLRNDLYCVGWGVKLYSLTTLYASFSDQKQLTVAAVCVCVSVIQSSPALVLDSGIYDVAADANCPDAIQHELPPLHVQLASRKAYFILVAGWPLHAKLVTSWFTVANQLLSLIIINV